MIRSQYSLDLNHELIIDNFAGGGGASTGIELALGRHVDIAINHDPEAVAMHAINHPQTDHHCESVWDVNPRELCDGRPVGLAWFSPDCKHFSKAKGGKPREKKIRGLAWVVLRWAATVRPRVIMLENVEEFRTWGPLLEDGQPCPKNKGRTFNSFINALKRQGYQVEHRELRACDYGAPTIRKRLFLIARCDGQPIVWPAPTHAAPDSDAVKSKRLKPWRTAAECIDWAIPCPSIFERNRPLAEATMKRIARGIQRYVIESAKPFIVSCNHTSNRTQYDCFRGQGIDEPVKTITASHGMGLVAPILTEHANASNQRNFSADEPLRTQCAEVKGGHYALVAPTLVGAGGPEYQGKPRTPDAPLHTLTTESHSAVCAAFLAKHYGGNNVSPGVNLDDPAATVTTVDHHALVSANLITYYGDKREGDFRGSGIQDPIATQTTENRHALVASTMVKLRGTCKDGQPMDQPAPTITASGTHLGDVRAFLIKYYGEGGQDQDARDPMHTIPTKDRIGLVMVRGEVYAIADIGMRMLEPRELYRAQGFPDSYIINFTYNGRQLPKHAQVRMVGNSVCPPLSAALVKANVPELAAWSSHEVKRRAAA